MMNTKIADFVSKRTDPYFFGNAEQISEAKKNYDMSGRNQVSRPNREESVENSEGHAP